MAKTEIVQIHPKMNEERAKDLIEEIKSHTANLMKCCYELYEGEGYKALGYDTFKECIIEELEGLISYTYANKMKSAGVNHMLLVADDAPLGSIPESIFRALQGLRDDDQKKEVWDAAIENAGGLYAISPIHVKHAVEDFKKKNNLNRKKGAKKIPFSAFLGKASNSLVEKFVSNFTHSITTQYEGGITRAKRKITIFRPMKSPSKQSDY